MRTCRRRAAQAPGLINTFGVHTLTWFNRASVAFHSLGVFSVAVALLAKAPTHLRAFAIRVTLTQQPPRSFGARRVVLSCLKLTDQFIDNTGVTQADGSSIGWAERASPECQSMFASRS